MGIQGRMAFLITLATLFTSAQFSFANEIEAVPGEFVVRLKESAARLQIKSLSIELRSEIKSRIEGTNLIVVRRPQIELQASAVAQLKENPVVENAEPNFIYRINRTPNDADFGKLWGLLNTGQSDGKQAGTKGIDIDAERAWDITTGSENNVIAVIDTGVDYTHPDIQANMWKNTAEANGKKGIDDDGNGYVDDIYGYDFSSDAGDPDPKDLHGHGTHCSGTIAGNGNDGAGIVGVSWKARLMAVRFLDENGSGTLDNAIRAINYATKMGAKIMSNSWGGGAFSQELQNAIQSAADKNILFVAAAGNSSSNNDTRPSYPASYPVPNVLSVAAIDNQGKLATFSNYGRKNVHVSAPGVNIYSSITNGNYDSWSGTSMATPHVSGVAALLLANEPAMSATELKARLIKTVKKLPALRTTVSSGGVVNAYQALTNTQAPPDPNDPENWARNPVKISTDHPYAAKLNQTFEVSVPGAKEISLYFEKFRTEANYDKLAIYDSSGALVTTMTGSWDDTHSQIIKGNYAKMVFTSDDSVPEYGFDLTAVAYR